MSLIWKPKFATNLTILSGRAYTEQGGFPWRHADRMKQVIFRLNEALDNAETDVDLRSGAPNAVPQPGAIVILPGTVLLVESEKMLVTSVSGATATVTRAYAGTSAVSHADGTDVTVFTTGDGVIDMTGVSWCSIITPAAWTAADLCAFCCPTRDGTFLPMRDEVGAILSISGIVTNAAASYYLPGKVNAGGPFVKFRSITVGTDPTSAVNQGADRTLIVVGGE